MLLDAAASTNARSTRAPPAAAQRARAAQRGRGGETAGVALMGIAFTALVLLGASALDAELGLPTAVAGVLTSIVVLVRTKTNPWTVVGEVSWSVLPLVAGLFVLVEGLTKTGLVEVLTSALARSTAAQ